MHTFGVTALLSGLLIAFIAQMYLTAMIFKVEPGKAFISLFIPGYIFLLAKRNGLYGKFLVSYVLGLIIFVIGGVILS